MLDVASVVPGQGGDGYRQELVTATENTHAHTQTHAHKRHYEFTHASWACPVRSVSARLCERAVKVEHPKDGGNASMVHDCSRSLHHSEDASKHRLLGAPLMEGCYCRAAAMVAEERLANHKHSRRKVSIAR